MPKKPKARPVAASENATGNPVSRKASSPQKSSGTKFWMRNCVISGYPH